MSGTEEAVREAFASDVVRAWELRPQSEDAVFYEAQTGRCEAAHRGPIGWRGGSDGLYFARILAAADAWDAEHDVYRVSGDLLRALEAHVDHGPVFKQGCAVCAAGVPGDAPWRKP